MSRIERARLPLVAVDLAPIEAAPSAYLVLGADGRVARVDGRTGGSSVLATATATGPDETRDAHAPRRLLHVSPDGAFAAVVNDHGQHGQVIDLATGRVTMTLRVGGPDDDQRLLSLFLAFTTFAGRAVVIHRSDWNRLDVSDAETGRLLTERGPTSYDKGEPPAHYLDYFHGALHPSPNGARIVDDGWVWHPVGVPAVWSVARWLTENPWESEDGPTRHDLCADADNWEHAVAWLDDDTLAIGGIGDDGTGRAEPGAHVFSATGGEVRAFPGPSGRFFGDGARLFSSDDHGLSSWDVASGAQTAHVAEARPTHHHRSARELAWCVDDTLMRFRF